MLRAVQQGDRRALAKAITLLESTRRDHRVRAENLLRALLPRVGQSTRLGISGVPGVGKSTFIEALGLRLIAQGRRVAVLAVDPSSGLSGGSILGDKTRMERLSKNDAAFIRPSPSAGILGGVALHTREAMLVCEAAGYDVVIVETVGVGQSEMTVAGMTDMFVLLQLPNAGDELQAMKKGVMELADLVLITKADIDPAAAARAEAQIMSVFRALRAGGNPDRDSSSWKPHVLQVSSVTGSGVDTFWEKVGEFIVARRASGEFDGRRQAQALTWTWDAIRAGLLADFHDAPAVKEALPRVLADVKALRIAPFEAAGTLIDLFRRSIH